MATKLENINLEIAHFKNFEKHIPNSDKFCCSTINTLLETGLIQVSTAFEHALANVGGLTVTSKDTEDLSDGSDGKLSTVRHHRIGKSYDAPVTNIAGKTGTLRVQVYERKNNQFYYFCIPHDAYSHISRTSNIEIPFELDGTPRRISKSKVNWWNYEVESFEKLSS